MRETFRSFLLMHTRDTSDTCRSKFPSKILYCFFSQKIQLVDGTPLYEHWVAPMLPTTTSLYLFTLENEEEFLQGDGDVKPVIKQKGTTLLAEC